MLSSYMWFKVQLLGNADSYYLDLFLCNCKLTATNKLQLQLQNYNLMKIQLIAKIQFDNDNDLFFLCV